MKLVFVSNYLNHHQIPLCNAFFELCNEFIFIATDTLNIQGYQNIANADYVIELNEETRNSVNEIVETADVVIFGSSPNYLITNRMKKNKLSFLYSERFYKKALWRSFNPISRKKLMERIGQYRKDNMFVLCASAFLPLDLRLLRFPTEKCYRWGYFPEILESISDVLKNKQINSIVWVGRLLDWKHPEMVIKAAAFLKGKGYHFVLNVLGDGPLMPDLKKMVVDGGLEGYVNLRGSCSHEDVRRFMELSKIFVFTSDKMEGWGAVLNEAMGCACAPIGSHLIGSVPFLITDEQNGLIYPQGDQDSLNAKIELLLTNDSLCNQYGEKAHQTMLKLWNANVAANRFVKLSQSLLNGLPMEEYKKGPCSAAVLLNERWIYKR